MAEARVAVDRGGPVHGDPPLLRQGEHREWRSTEPEDSHQDRDAGGGRDALHGRAPEDSFPWQRAATVYYPLTDDEDEGGGLAAGGRPPALAEPWPQVGIQQYSGIGYELVLALDAPVLHAVDDDFGILSDAQLKNLLFQCQVRRRMEEGYLGEVVDVPGQGLGFYTSSGDSVNITAPVGEEPADEHDLPFERDVHDPFGFSEIFFWNRRWMFPYMLKVPGSFLKKMWNRWWMFPYMFILPGSFLRKKWNRWSMFPYMVMLPWLSEEDVEQVVDVPGSGARSAAEGPPSRVSAASLDAPQEPFQGFFRTFPRGKKCESWAAVDCQSHRAVELVHAGALWRRGLLGRARRALATVSRP